MTIRWPTKFKKAHLALTVSGVIPAQAVSGVIPALTVSGVTLALTVSGVIPAQAGIQTNPHLCQCLHRRIAHLGGTDFSGARFVDIGRA